VDCVLHDRQEVCDTFIWYLFAIHQLLRPNAGSEQLTSVSNFGSQTRYEHGRTSVAGIPL